MHTYECWVRIVVNGNTMDIELKSKLVYGPQV